MKLGDRVTHLPSGVCGVIVAIDGQRFTLDNPVFPGPYQWSAEWCASDSEAALKAAVVNAAIDLIDVGGGPIPASHSVAFQKLQHAVVQLVAIEAEATFP